MMLLTFSIFLSLMNPSYGQEILGIGSREMHIQRGMVVESVARKLFHDLLVRGAPLDQDEFDPRVFQFNGDAGEKVWQPNTTESIRKSLQKLVGQDTQEKQSAILRVENLAGDTYNLTKELINEVIPNRVLEDDGTIHLYMSSSEAAALANHTDVTDIFVLQLDGAKEWVLCKESIFDAEQVRDKLDSCTTYDTKQVDGMFCERSTLYPGDALWLPRRVVHSARAVKGALSAHLTFAFAETQCAAPKPTIKHPEAGQDHRDLQRSTCSKSQNPRASSCDQSCNECPQFCNRNNGGINCRRINCNDGCDEGCNLKSCNVGPPCNCNCFLRTSQCAYPPCPQEQICTGCCTTHCDLHSCDDSCDHSCQERCECPSVCNRLQGGRFCDSSCDTCPTPHPTPRPTRRPTPRPTRRPTPRPTRRPTPRPTRRPTLRPTRRPTPRPTRRPTPRPSPRPSPRPTRRPSPRPSPHPSPRPTPPPTPRPSPPPSPSPTRRLTAPPSPPPTPFPTPKPSPSVTPRPTSQQTPLPTLPPTVGSTPKPTSELTMPPVGVVGDPHFKTFSGKMFDYMGACDLVLVHAPKFAKNGMLDIHIRTKIRYDYSYIETAAIRIGEDTLEVGSYGQFFLNGVDGAMHHRYIGHLSGFNITHIQENKKRHHFKIQIHGKEQFVVKTFKDWVSILIESADVERFVGSYGMMGEFGTGTMFGRDGRTVIDDPILFGDEWQVRDNEPMLFQSINGPQFPDKCELTNAAMVKGRRLGEEKSSP